MIELRAELRALSNRQRIAYAEVVELWMERAAIREFDGGMARADAERAALDDVKTRYA